MQKNSTGMKTKRFIYVIIAVLIIVALSYYFYDSKSRQAQAPSADISEVLKTENSNKQNGQENMEVQNEPTENIQNADQSSQTEQSSGEAKQSEGTFSSGSEAEVSPGADILVTEIVYDGQKFTPDVLDILVGDVVIFTNNGSKDFWPASNNHPTHTLYPEFDAKGPIAPGGKYQFTFEKAGSWGFHDHLNPSVGGAINVSEK